MNRGVVIWSTARSDGGNTGILFVVYTWKGGPATLENNFALAKAKT